jgi:7-cyano-7-deazaguanine reductase
MKAYTDEHAVAGVHAVLPAIECWPNQYPRYEITIDVPEYTSVCPKTGLPDFGKITIQYMPDRWCVELKSFKEYLLSYRNLGIFYENAVNRILRDFVNACRPEWVEVVGEFSSRGGISTSVRAQHVRQSVRRKPRAKK